MIKFKGKQRVIISNVCPEIDQGQFPGKAAVNEPIAISADIFSDGHDEISASLFIRKVSQRKWTEFPMHLVSNDHWNIRLVPDEIGFYEFRIEGWVDQYKTWKHGLTKKKEAGQDISVELQIGAAIMLDAQRMIKHPDLAGWYARLADPDQQEAAYQLAISEEVAALMYKYRLSDQTTAYPKTLKIEVERKKAAYSTWYELFPRSTAAEGIEHGTFNDVIPFYPESPKWASMYCIFRPFIQSERKTAKEKTTHLTQ